MTHPSRALLLAVAAAVGVAAAPARAQVATVDLAADADIEFNGASAGDHTGRSLALADTNSDGRRELLLGSPGLSPFSRAGAGGVRTIFSFGASPIDLAGDDSGGLQTSGAVPRWNAGQAVAPAGDVNGDGIGDQLIGARFASPGGRSQAGAVYVVFGRRDSSDVDLAALGSQGFVIEGAGAGDRAGTAVSAAGDLNGDGFADVIVGAPRADPAGRTDAGIAYVIFGSPASETIALSALGARGYMIFGANSGDGAASAVAGSQDVNGDSARDMLIGAPLRRDGEGAAYLVLGKGSLRAVDLRSLGTDGYVMRGASAYDAAGSALADAGDVNGDGISDHLVGATLGGGLRGPGAVYVVNGKRDPSIIELGALGRSGYMIKGATYLDHTGAAVAGLGDINGDSIPDALIGAPDASNSGRIASGSAYVVYGKRGSRTIDLGSFPAIRGYRIDGAEAGDKAGVAVAGPGRLGGGGRDLIIGAPNNSASGRKGAGSAYVIFGTAGKTGRGRPGLLADIGPRVPEPAFVIPRAQRARRSASPSGTMITYTLRGAARVRLRALRVASGYRVRDEIQGARCRAVRAVFIAKATPKRTTARAVAPKVLCETLKGGAVSAWTNVRRCVAPACAAVWTVRHKGAGRFRFALGRRATRSLSPGRYILDVVAIDKTGRAHGPARLRFSVRGPARRR